MKELYPDLPPDVEKRLWVKLDDLRAMIVRNILEEIGPYPYLCEERLFAYTYVHSYMMVMLNMVNLILYKWTGMPDATIHDQNQLHLHPIWQKIDETVREAEHQKVQRDVTQESQNVRYTDQPVTLTETPWWKKATPNLFKEEIDWSTLSPIVSLDTLQLLLAEAQRSFEEFLRQECGPYVLKSQFSMDIFTYVNIFLYGWVDKRPIWVELMDTLSDLTVQADLPSDYDNPGDDLILY